MAGAAARAAAAGALPGLPLVHRPPWVWRESRSGLALVEKHGGRLVLSAGIRGILWTTVGPREVQLTAEHPVARTLADSAAVAATAAELLAVAGDPDDPTGLVAALACRWDDVRTGYLAMQLQRLRRLVPAAEGGL